VNTNTWKDLVPVFNSRCLWSEYKDGEGSGVAKVRQVSVLRRRIDYHEVRATVIRVRQASMPAMYSSFNKCTKWRGHVIEPCGLSSGPLWWVLTCISK
jgi:hypothetical protein